MKIERLLDRIGISSRFIGEHKANLAKNIIQAYAEQQVSIAVEKYRDRLLESELNNCFDVTVAYSEILEELKGGEGEK